MLYIWGTIRFWMATLKTLTHMKRNANRSTAAQTENKQTKSATRNSRKAEKQTQPVVSAPDVPVPANVEDVEARLAEKKTTLSEAKKSSQKSAEKFAKANEDYRNQLYVVATLHMNLGTASPEELALIAGRKTDADAETALAKFFAKTFKDSDEVAKAREDVQKEEGGFAAAKAEIVRQWTKGYKALFATIGITGHKTITPKLLTELCPYLMVATADGLKAARVGKSAVRKNGKAVKKNGKRVYKYTLKERTKWTAYGLYETLERNFRMNGFFSEDELKVRLELLTAEVNALKALKKAKDDAKSEAPEKAAEAADRMDALKQAAKAAGEASKENAATGGSKEAKAA